MDHYINETKKKSFTMIIQGLIDSTLNALKEESDEWGMGEMDELDEVSSVENIVVDNIDKTNGLLVSVTIHKNSRRNDFDNLISEIEARMSDWIPNIELYVNEIIDERKFGPGIDW
jgi:hypothetical protein